LDVTEISRPEPASREEAPTMRLAPAHEGGVTSDTPPAPSYQQCDECGAPVDDDQRYCVVCGAHRRHVNDPAARHLSQTSARSRNSRASAGGQPTRRSAARSRGLGTALVLAVIPVAAAVGVAVGRSSNSEDGQLIQALAKRQATVQAPASAAATAPAATVRAAAATAAHRGKLKRTSSRSVSHTKSGGKVVSTTRYGSVRQITGSKPTQAQEQQGAQATQQVQKSTGKSYVNQQSNLPGTVVVP
jgi:hypothetical protein